MILAFVLISGAAEGAAPLLYVGLFPARDIRYE